MKKYLVITTFLSFGIGTIGYMPTTAAMAAVAINPINDTARVHAFAHSLAKDAKKYPVLKDKNGKADPEGRVWIESTDKYYKKGARDPLPSWVVLDVSDASKQLDAKAPKVAVWQKTAKGKNPDPVGLEPHGIEANRDYYPLIHPLRQVTPLPTKLERGRLYDFKDKNKTTQFVADLLAVRLYRTEVLPKFGLSPIEYSPDAGIFENGASVKWEKERQQYATRVLAAAEKYAKENGIDPYQPEKYGVDYDGKGLKTSAQKTYIHPFATKEDPTGREYAKTILDRLKITQYQQLFLVNPTYEPVVNNGIDELTGLPYTRNPYSKEINLVGSGFYFWTGENEAIDAVIRVKDEKHNQVYYLCIMRGDAKPKYTDGTSTDAKKGESTKEPRQIAIVGGMPDKEEEGPRNIFKELREESGLQANYNAMKANLKKLAIGFVGGEARQIATAGTTTNLYLMEFESWKDFFDKFTLNSTFDPKEVAGRYFISESYLLNRMMNTKKDPDLIFASHYLLFSYALGRVLADAHSKDPNYIKNIPAPLGWNEEGTHWDLNNPKKLAEWAGVTLKVAEAAAAVE